MFHYLEYSDSYPHVEVTDNLDEALNRAWWGVIWIENPTKKKWELVDYSSREEWKQAISKDIAQLQAS